MRICVLDGQGGGIGSAVIRRLREVFEDKLEIVALGTNAVATAAMLKAGANRGATGENAVVRNVGKAHAIVGSVGIVMAHAMWGEMTPAMAEAVASSEALKILIPLSQEQVVILGLQAQPLPHLLEEMVKQIHTLMEEGHV